jgi:hypothetical protein
VDYYKHGGILPYVLRDILGAAVVLHLRLIASIRIVGWA